jgi:hypothetical protein
VTPISTGVRYRLSFEDVTFEVEPLSGGRITTFALGSINLLLDSAATGSPINWGSTFWTSPQAAWDGMASTTGDWPPPAPVDSSPYTGGISASHVVLTSSPYQTLGVTITKDFSADSATRWVTLTYTITSSGNLTVAPWEVSRVVRGGIAFFPPGASANPGSLTLTTASEVTWFDDAGGGSSGKALADGSGGWLAYVVGGVLFLKRFQDVVAQQQAQGEGEIELYADPANRYLELEVQGPLTNLAPGGTLPWTVQWRAVRLPTTLTPAVGNPELVAFVRQQVMQ